MIEWILTIVLVLNVFFIGCVVGWMSKIYSLIGSIHHAEIVAHTSGWADCLKCMDALKERKEE